MPTPLEEEKDIPESLEYIWNWWCEVQTARQSSGFGPLPLSFTEMYAWSVLTQRQLQPWEVEAIRDIDHAFLTESMKEE